MSLRAKCTQNRLTVATARCVSTASTPTKKTAVKCIFQEYSNTNLRHSTCNLTINSNRRITLSYALIKTQEKENDGVQEIRILEQDREQLKKLLREKSLNDSSDDELLIKLKDLDVEVS